MSGIAQNEHIELPSDAVQPARRSDEADECCVCVAVHVRPLIDSEVLEGCQSCLTTFAKQPEVQVEKRSFAYDHVFGWSSAAPTTLYDRCIQPLVDGIFRGYNATVFAYGQTGSGKTYTMGSAFAPGRASSGVIPRVMDSIFSSITASADADYIVRVGFVEIYQESIRDLLIAGGGTAVDIQIREDGAGGICLAGATERQVESKAEMAALLEQGALLRATGSTSMNKQSSRSHAIFTITVEQRRTLPPMTGEHDQDGEADGAVDDYLCAKMHLVDLAGSERLQRTQAEADRRTEGIAINKGLLSLGKVINALAEGLQHVPYRDSKLTRMLQDSLGGNSRTVMIACVSPADINLEETLSTLRYAARARAIRNKPVVNRDPNAAAIAHLRQQLAAARAEVLALKRGGSGAWDPSVGSLKAAGDEMLAGVIEEEQAKRVRAEAEVSRLRMALADARHEAEVLGSELVGTQAARDSALQRLSVLAASVGPEACAAAGVTHDAQHAGESIANGHLQKIAELEREVRRLRKAQKLSGAMVVSARRQSLAASPAPAGMIQGGSSPMPLPLASPAPFNCALDSITDAEDDLAFDEEFAASEQAHIAEQARELAELEELERELAAREAKLAAVQAGSATVLALKASYERLSAERDSLQKERTQLLQKLQALQQSTVGDRAAMEQRYRKRLSEMDARLKQVRLEERRAQRAEALYARSMQTVARLQDDIQGIKQQKVQLQRRMDGAAKDFALLRKDREREVLQLRRQERKTALHVQRLEAAQAKQQAVLRRKTEEAEAARKRLKDMKEVQRGGADKRERSLTARGGAAGVEVQPNNAAPLLRDEHARRQWVEQELDACCQAIDLQRVLEGERAERGDVARRLAELDKRAALGHVPPSEHQQQRLQLLTQQQRLSSQIMETQASLRKAQQEEIRSSANGLGPGSSRDVQRWTALKSIAEARAMLQTLFRAAAEFKAQMFEGQQQLLEARDEADDVRERIEAAEAEAERAKQAEAVAQQAAAEAFANSATTPRSRMSPASPERRKSIEQEYESLMTDLKAFRLQPSAEPSAEALPAAQDDPDSSPVNEEPARLSFSATGILDSASEGEGSPAEAEGSDHSDGDENEDDSEEDDVWRPETATPAVRPRRGRATSMARRLGPALDLAQSQQTGDAEGAQARPVVQAINRERSQQGRSPVERLTVPLLKEHLRGKICGGNPWKPGAKKRSELISDYSEYLALPVSPQQEGQRIGAFTGSSPLTQAAPGGQVLDSRADMLNTREAPHSTSRLPAGLQSGPPLPEASQSPTKSLIIQRAASPQSAAGMLQSHALSPSSSPRLRPNPPLGDSTALGTTDAQTAASDQPGAMHTDDVTPPLPSRTAPTRPRLPETPATSFYKEQCNNTLRRVRALNEKMARSNSTTASANF